MSSVLIIGSSHSIVETFSKKFINEDLAYLNFRDVWNNRKIDNYDFIVLSGYHHQILGENINSLDIYIQDYNKFILEISKKTKSLLFISTFVPNKSSFSRVAFFYNSLQKKLINRKNIKILVFKKIIDSKMKKSPFFYFLQKIGLQFTAQSKIINFTEQFYLKKLKRPRFYFLKIKRPVFIERILRLFDRD